MGRTHLAGIPSAEQLLLASDLEQRKLAQEEIPRAALTDAVREYLTSIPHHKRPTEPCHCDISKGWEFRFYRIVFSMLIETRTVARQRVPYRGWNIPPKTKDESNINAWSYAMPQKTLDDELEPKTSIVSDSQSVHDCSRCSVSGWLNCDNCSARGKTSCPGCAGRGRITCTGCAGAGKLTRTRVVVREEKCKNCALNTVANILAVFDDNPYTRARSCRTCGGTGIRRWKENEQFTVDCKRCKTSGEESCQTCKTTGQIACAGCAGKGKVGCPDCDKCKRVVSYLSVTQEHRRLVAEDIALPDSFAEVVKQEHPLLFREGATQLVCEDIAENLSLQPYRTAVASARIAGQIGKKSCCLAEKTRREKPEQGRIVQERVSLFRGVSYGFQYAWRGKAYKAVTRPIDVASGHLKGVVPHVSPATRWLCEQMRESNSLAQSGDAREAALLLGRCKEVAAADRVCSAYLQEGISKLPEKVLEMSDRVTFTHTQILFFSSAAIMLVVAALLGFLINAAIPAALATAVATILLLMGIVFGRSQADIASQTGTLSTVARLFHRKA